MGDAELFIAETRLEPAKEVPLTEVTPVEESVSPEGSVTWVYCVEVVDPMEFRRVVLFFAAVAPVGLSWALVGNGARGDSSGAIRDAI